MEPGKHHAARMAIGLAGLAALCAPCAVAGTLMQRALDKPVVPIDRNHPWRAVHVANAAILAPEESPDGLWRMYIRGSGYYPGEGGSPEEHYHDTIGLFTQDDGSFSPFGPWKEHPGNPVLRHGPREGYDGKHLLDCAPVWGKARNGKDVLLMFYKGVGYGTGGSLAGAYSIDGGLTFEKFAANPLQERIGPCDAVFHKGRYYVFYGDVKYDAQKRRPTDRLKTYLAITTDPTGFANAPRRLALDTGPEGAFDSYSVHGGRIFRLNRRWYMVYQCSVRHMDYPERFHVAWSDDLVNWTKVVHPQPFFTRGEAGTWDEGGIWYGEVFEHKGTLYMYYEGWGSGKPDYDRDTPYAPGGYSQTGLASVPAARFLEWCGHQRQMEDR